MDIGEVNASDACIRPAVIIYTFYKYANLGGDIDLEACCRRVKHFVLSCEERGVALTGRLLLASDGVNGTYACADQASSQALQNLIADLHPSLSAGIVYKDNAHDMGSVKVSPLLQEHQLFPDFKCTVGREVVGTGARDCAAFKTDLGVSFDDSLPGGLRGSGTHLPPSLFLQKANSGNSIVLDIRNAYEYDIGHLRGALRLPITTYTQTWKAIDEALHEHRAELVGPSTTTEVNVGECGDTEYVGPNDVHDHVKGVADGHADADEKSGTNRPQPKPPKDILMYCTGGIRCELASAYCKSRLAEMRREAGAEGIVDAGGGGGDDGRKKCDGGDDHGVYQLEGGVHEMLKENPDGGNALARTGAGAAGGADCAAVWDGKLFVFDGRVSYAPPATTAAGGATVVGACIDCGSAWDEYSGAVVCTVCRSLVLVCPSCLGDEHHCLHHRELKMCYFTNLEKFSRPELLRQKACLVELLQNGDKAQKSRNYRKTLSKQIDKIEVYLANVTTSADRDFLTDGCVAGLHDFHDSQVLPREKAVQHTGSGAMEEREGKWGFWRALVKDGSTQLYGLKT